MARRRADIVVVGTSIDPHVDAVLQALGGDRVVARLDVDRFPRVQRLSASHTGPGVELLLHEGGTEWDISSPDACWFRRLGRPGLDEGLPESDRRFAYGEADSMLDGVLSTIRPRRWINEYWACRRAATKLFQYERARSLGIAVPDTAITTDVATAQGFLARWPRAVYKTLSAPVLTDTTQPHRTGVGRALGVREMVFTTELDAEARAALGSVALVPCQFQPLVEKAYELRVTSVRDEHFAVRIESQSVDAARLDWRAAPEDVPCSGAELPPPAARQLTSLMRELGLEFGASDWIVTPEGELVFLELNPHGAWLWLEERLPRLAITKSMAALLEAPVPAR